MTPPKKSQLAKEKINKSDFNKMRNFGPSKNTRRKVKRQPTEQEKAFANQISRRAQSPEYGKDCYNSIIKRQRTQLVKGQWI